MQFKFITEKNKGPERIDKIGTLMSTQREKSTHTHTHKAPGLTETPEAGQDYKHC